MTIPAARTGQNFVDGQTITIGSTVFEFNKPLGINVEEVPNNAPRATDLLFTFLDNAGQTVTVELDTNGTANNAGVSVRVNMNGLNPGVNVDDRILLAQRISFAINNLRPNLTRVVGTTILINGSHNFTSLRDVPFGNALILQVDPDMRDGRLTDGTRTAIPIDDFVSSTDVGNAIASAFNLQGLPAVNVTLPNGDSQINVQSNNAASSNVPSSNLTISFTGGLNVGNVQGTAYINDQLWVATDTGFISRVSTANGRSLAGATTQFIDPSTGQGYVFSGLSRGPRFLEGGVYKNILFASTLDGQILAIDVTPGQAASLAPIFAAGRSSIKLETRIDNAQTFLSANGLAFSTNEFNLWHVTNEEALTPGHGVNNSFDGSRGPSP